MYIVQGLMIHNGVSKQTVLIKKMDKIQLNRQPVSNIPNYKIHTLLTVNPSVSRAALTDVRIVITI